MNHIIRHCEEFCSEAIYDHDSVRILDCPSGILRINFRSTRNDVKRKNPNRYKPYIVRCAAFFSLSRPAAVMVLLELRAVLP